MIALDKRRGYGLIGNILEKVCEKATCVVYLAGRGAGGGSLTI